MVSFRTKKIETALAAHERLARERELKYLSLDKVAGLLKISKDYLRMLEDGNYDALPGEVYTKNFIKLYAKFLELNPDEILEQYKRERSVRKNIEVESKIRWDFHKPATIISRIQMLSLPKIFRNFSIAFITVICLLYIGYKVEAIIRPPELAVIYPSEDILSIKKYIEVKGKTLPQARVAINGQNVVVEEDGEFAHSVNLEEGVNEITISAKRDHSRDAVITRRVVVQKDS